MLKLAIWGSGYASGYINGSLCNVAFYSLPTLKCLMQAELAIERPMRSIGISSGYMFPIP